MTIQYNKVIEGVFLKRPNRFIAHVLINDKEEIVHVKNTGRCEEILRTGVKVFLEESNNPNRKTKYSLISVYKKNKLINIDSQVPNQVIYEALVSNKMSVPQLKRLNVIKKEKKYHTSRFDIYYEKQGIRGFMEIKGVTLENHGIAMFPDAPTVRGKKHLEELIRAHKEGYETFVCFLVQMKGINQFIPNHQTDPLFTKALREAQKEGVNVIGYNSIVSRDKILLNDPIEINLE